METGDNIWEVFIQKKPGIAFKHAGSVHGYDKKMAVQNARDAYCRRGEGRELWVVPSSSIVSVPMEDADAYFDPQEDKIYRHPTFYKIPAEVKNI